MASETKIYNINNFLRFGFILIAIVAIESFIWFTKIDDVKGFWLGIFGSIGAVICIYFAWNFQYEIREDAIIWRLNFFKWPHTKVYYFKDIQIVNEDSFFFLHFFHVLKQKRWPRVIINNGLIHWRDFLREIVLRVNPKAYVDDKTLEYAGLTRADIGKLFKS